MQFKIWLKEDFGVKVNLFEVSLNPDNDAVSNILNHVIEEMDTHKARACALEVEKNTMENRYDEARTRLQECEVLKNQIEADLYAKFVTVLKNKKDRIRELHQKVQDFEKAKQSRPTQDKPRANQAASSNSETADTPQAPKRQLERSDSEAMDHPSKRVALSSDDLDQLDGPAVIKESAPVVSVRRRGAR
eukprot:Colp12_sorted_trinity150504_noHs@3642